MIENWLKLDHELSARRLLARASPLDVQAFSFAGATSIVQVTSLSRIYLRRLIDIVDAEVVVPKATRYFVSEKGSKFRGFHDGAVLASIMQGLTLRSDRGPRSSEELVTQLCILFAQRPSTAIS